MGYRDATLTRLRDRRVLVAHVGEVYVDEVIEHRVLGHCTVVECRGGLRQQLVVRFPEGHHACYDIVSTDPDISAGVITGIKFTFNRFG